MPANSLRFRWQFLRFFKESEVFRLSECVVFRIRNAEGSYRLGITMKARGMSVERNAVKRAIREGFRRLGPHLGSFDYNVVVPKTKNLSFPYVLRLKAALETEFKNALSRRGIG